MACQFLDGPPRRSARCQMRAERVPKDMDALADIRAPSGAKHPRLHELPSQRLPIVVTEHARSTQVSVLPKGVRQLSRERHVSQASALRRVNLTIPVAPLHADLMLRQVHVSPFEGEHLSAPEPRFAAEQ